MSTNTAWPLEVFLDLTTTTHGQGRAAGAIRVESEFASALLDRHGDVVTPISWSSATEGLLELDRDVARRYVAGDGPAGEVGGAPLARPARTGTQRRILLATGAGWLSNPTFFHGLLAARRALDAELHVVVHDLVHLLFPHWVSRDEAARFGSTLEAMLTAADRVLVYSDSTARDIARVAARRALRVHDVGRMALGTALAGGQAPDAPVAPGLAGLADRPFVMYVSTIARRKNHEFIAQVWARLVDELAERLPRMIFAGRVAPDQEPMMERLRRDPALVDHLIHLPAASDADLVWLHRHCLFTVFPSLYEGWGLPVAESLALGKVCVASNASSIPEVAGGVTPLLDPLDIRAWTDEIRRLVTEPDALRAAEARLTGYRAVTWEDAAATVWTAIQPAVAPQPDHALPVADAAGPRPLAPLVTAADPWRPIRDAFGAIIGHRARFGVQLSELPPHGIRVALTMRSASPGPVHVETEINGLVLDGCALDADIDAVRALDVPRDVLLHRGLLDIAALVRPLEGASVSPPVSFDTIAATRLTREQEASAITARRDAWRLGETLLFTAGSPHVALFREGWGDPAHWGTWSVEPTATLVFRPLPQPSEPLVLRALVRGFVSPAQPRLEVDVCVGGTRLTTWTFAHPSDFSLVERAVTIPVDLLDEGVARLELSMPAVRSPRELGMSQDERRLGIGLARAHCSTPGGPRPDAGWKGRSR
jgi:glycosyltransferase involved in cell wall biosynthesis